MCGGSCVKHSLLPRTWRALRTRAKPTFADFPHRPTPVTPRVASPCSEADMRLVVSSRRDKQRVTQYQRTIDAECESGTISPAVDTKPWTQRQFVSTNLR